MVITEPQKPDLVVEARELLSAYDKNQRIGYGFQLLRQLCDEVERLREHVNDLNHDLDTAVKECNEHCNH